MLKHFFSFDWDYFINASKEVMEDLVPAAQWVPRLEDGCREEWIQMYRIHPELKGLKTIPEDLNTLFGTGRQIFHQSYVGQKHVEIFDFISGRTMYEEKFVLFNFDHHHDCFMGSSKVDSSNWLRILKDIRPNMTVYWVTDRQAQQFFEGSKIITQTYFRENGNIARMKPEIFFTQSANLYYGFLCKSDPWTPPHLNYKFRQFATDLMRRSGRTIVNDKTCMDTFDLFNIPG